MSKVKEIQEAIESLSEKDYHSFRNWFYKRENDLWDEEIIGDSETGRLDFLKEDAIKEMKQNKLKKL